jgi:hypothetical protein
MSTVDDHQAAGGALTDATSRGDIRGLHRDDR